MTDQSQFCTFYLKDLFFGIQVEKVQEVIRFQTMTKLPLAPPMVKGLINLRGEIVTALDMRFRLGFEMYTPDDTPVNVVVHTTEGIVSLLVDKIGDIMQVSEDSFEKSPETLVGEARDLICGAHKLEDRLMLILDIEKVVNLNKASLKPMELAGTF